MSVRRLPVRPDLDQIKRQAEEFLRAIHDGDASVIAELREHHPDAPIRSGGTISTAFERL